jgi:hypothetical protein
LHVSTIVVHLVETLVVVFLCLDGGRKYVFRGKETAQCSDDTLQCSL